MSIILSTILASTIASSIASSALLVSTSDGLIQPAMNSDANSEHVERHESGPYENASALLKALAEHDRVTDSLTGTIRFTTINALENDRKQRFGKLAIRRDEAGDRRYAVSFNTLLIDDRQEKIAEHYIFDGRWFVERLPDEKQFNKRELVPAGEKLDPMELMRDAPFWVSLGSDQDRLLASYDAELLDSTDGLVENEDFPELEFLADQPYIAGAQQIKLTPKPGSGFEDDWEWVRIWVNPETLTPVLYIKAEWTGDLQIVELFAVKTNVEIPLSVFDTSTPNARDGWRVQISHWRGKE